MDQRGGNLRKTRSNPLPRLLRILGFLNSNILASTALFAVLWAIARAAVQAVTIDEADTYLGAVEPAWPSHWFPAANNHVLNSMLMRLITSVFGVSHLTVRAPALIGAVIYVFAAYCFSKLITPDLKLQWPLFVCLVFNPFVFDYLVAARGYGLATAFLLCAIGIPFYFRLENSTASVKPLMLACILSSSCAGLSFAANLSFGFVDAATVLLIFIWAAKKQNLKHYAQLLAACILPALLIVLFLCAPAVLGLRRADLFYGATSLHETLNSIVSSSLYELNPYIVNPLLYGPVSHLRPFLFPLLGAACLYQVVVLFLNRVSNCDSHTKWLAALGTVVACIVVVSLSAHWLSFHVLQLLLPKERTAIFFVPLCTLLVGVLAAIPLPSRSGKIGRVGLIVVLYTLGGFFLMCLRLGYFKEWKFDADVKNVYFVLSYYNHTFGIRNVSSSWMYVPSLNFYRQLSGTETFAEFVSSNSYPVDRLVYVLWDPGDHPFLEEQKLKVVYRGERSGVVVAIRPEAETVR